MNAPLRRECLAGLPLARSRVGGALLAALGLVLAAIIILTPLAPEAQGVFALGGLLVALLIGRFRGRAATLAASRRGWRRWRPPSPSATGTRRMPCWSRPAPWRRTTRGSR
ncbi:hypothetical protein [Roseicella frigidaeris]|uniref:hypothetical protein n=1 Tax=Roseicella frigidaeris TaxID=2230885 RepID=UPI001401D5D5|nr:hypothetical protein [Roseicella frigidaeris]